MHVGRVVVRPIEEIIRLQLRPDALDGTCWVAARLWYQGSRQASPACHEQTRGEPAIMQAQRCRSSRALVRAVMRPAALVLAYLLVLQVLLVGLTQGLQAAPSENPGFLGIFCSTNVPAGPDRPAVPGPAGHADCCVLGCQMFGPSVAPPPAAATFAPLRSGYVSAPAPSVATPSFLSVQPSPRSTRGPPRTV